MPQFKRVDEQGQPVFNRVDESGKPSFVRATEQPELTGQALAEARAGRKKDVVQSFKEMAEQQKRMGEGYVRMMPEVALTAVTAGASAPIQAAAGAVIGGVEGGVPGAITGGLIGLLPAALRKIPSLKRAGEKFETVMGKAKDVPIDTTAAEKAIVRAQELRQRGSTMPKVMNDFSKNRAAATTGELIGEPVTEPMTYGVGRDFASNAGALSSREATSLNAKMHRQVAEFASAMKTANREAAEKVGMGKLYDEAMKEYRQAASLHDAADVLKKWAVRALLVAGAGSAGAAGYEMWKSH